MTSPTKFSNFKKKHDNVGGIVLMTSFSKCAAGLSAEDALQQYAQNGFLWLSPSADSSTSCSPQNVMEFLRKQNAEHPKVYSKNWSVENLGDAKSDEELQPDRVLTNDSHGVDLLKDRRFYVSTIIHKSSSEALDELMEGCAERCPPILSTTYHDGGAWLFIGNAGRNGSKKRKVGEEKAVSSSALEGRAEHVDEVTHSGTWHVQLSGSKTWTIRPNFQAEDWKTANGAPDLSKVPGAEKSPATGSWRLVIRVQEGDVLLLNTRAWYHQTKLEQAGDENSWSISLARDFYLPYPAPKDFQPGDVILEEEDIEDGFDLPKSSDAEIANCLMIEIDDDECAEDDSIASSNDDAPILLVATRPITKHEPLILRCADDGAGEPSEEYNASEGIDPRAFAKSSFKRGDIVLGGDDIPDAMPCSDEPNCQMDEGNAIIRAIASIESGDVLCMAPKEGDEYERIEVDLQTNSILRSS